MSDASFHRSLQTESGCPQELAERIRGAEAATPELLSDVIHEICWRFSSIPWSNNSHRIGRLIQSGAWTDAALTLLELELPQWQVRRIAYDEGEWYCALSRQRELPDWLDQSIEGRHATLALAILSAFVNVKLIDTSSAAVGAPGLPRTAPLYTPMCCDNFS